MIAKFTGFEFYSLKASQSNLIFQRTYFDVAVFFFNLVLSIYTFTWSRERIEIEVNSPIVKFGTEAVLKLSFVSIVATKIVLMIWAKKNFKTFQIFNLIDKKV